jgi:hypothetical protein
VTVALNRPRADPEPVRKPSASSKYSSRTAVRSFSVQSYAA